MNEKIYFAHLHSTGFSQAELLSVFGEKDISPREVYENISDSYLEKLGISLARRKVILQGKENFLRENGEKKNREILAKLSVSLVSYNDADYPESLRHIPHIPFLLYVRGGIPKKEMFGVVGSRKISSYGKKVIEVLVPDIAQNFVIVSGGAAGCDTYAHKTALEHSRVTLSVIGTGIDQNYPVSNAKMFDEIAISGAVISIFRMGEPGNPYNFPVRNEIVVGLCRGVCVVEAAEKSGSLITAALALDLGKDLFAVPGDILSQNSFGSNLLIKSGQAKCVMFSGDVLEEYDAIVKTNQHEKTIPELSKEELGIYMQLQGGEKDVECLSESLDFPSHKIAIHLSMLELKGLVKKDLSGKFRIS